MNIRIPALILAAGAVFSTGAFAQSSDAVVQPRIVVPSSSVTNDQLIKSEVIDRIAADSRLSGQVGVETFQNTVTLTGRVLDPKQIDWAEQDARSIDGVKDVTNLVRARLGDF